MVVTEVVAAGHRGLQLVGNGGHRGWLRVVTEGHGGLWRVTEGDHGGSQSMVIESCRG